jgi:hypothetical protein
MSGDGVRTVHLPISCPNWSGGGYTTRGVFPNFAVMDESKNVNGSSTDYADAQRFRAALLPLRLPRSDRRRGVA